MSEEEKITLYQTPLPKEAHVSEDSIWGIIIKVPHLIVFALCHQLSQKWDLCPVPKPTVQLINYISRWFTADADPIWLGPWFIHTLDNIHWIY